MKLFPKHIKYSKCKTSEAHLFRHVILKENNVMLAEL